MSRFLILIAWSLAGAAHAADSSSWLTLRTLDTAVLQSIVDADSNPSRRRAEAALVLTDRALNQSVERAQHFLERAELLVAETTDAQAVAQSLRCQLDHRRGLAEARETCAQVIGRRLNVKSDFAAALDLATAMYYHYREGDHEQSMATARELVDRAALIDDPGLLAAAHNMVGLHFATGFRPRMSLPHFETALENARQLAYPEYKIIVYLNLASSYTYLGRVTEALEMLEESSLSPVVSLYPTRRLVVAGMLTEARLALGMLAGEEARLRAVVADVEGQVLPDSLTFAHKVLGKVLLKQGRPQAALVEFDQVLAITGHTFATGLTHPRIQLMVVAYSDALRETGQTAAALSLLDSVIANASRGEPDQLLLDAYRAKAATHEAAGDLAAARTVAEAAVRLESQLWDASLQYQVARLNASLATDRQQLELTRARERAAALRDRAEREAALRRQSWLLGALVIMLAGLLQYLRSQKLKASTERAQAVRLEEQVAARTRELEDQMALRMEAEIEHRRIIKKMSEGEKMRALGQLTAGVAHDFNNLMTVVTLGADQLRSRLIRDDDEPSAEVLGHIVEAADTGARITRGLLAYVRKQPLQPEILALDDFLEQARPIFRNTLGERIELDMHLEPCQALVDKGQLTTSMLNLLLNAREAMPNGGPIWVSLRSVDERIDIVVRDSGLGMAADVRQRAVDPFFTTKDVGEGTGLGLSMVFGFARQSGGDLAIQSAPGQGTSVTLSLPHADASIDESIEHRIPTNAVSRYTRVLAVEDRAMLLHVLKPTLEQLGMAVHVAANAQQALEYVARDGLPDVLISDIVMPGDFDGIDLAQRLRQRQHDLPVVLMSGCSTTVDMDCEFLRKPFSVDELWQAVERAMGRVEAPDWSK
ncbi:MAG: ATP-binding protein [Pseudomonadota bacterium]